MQKDFLISEFTAVFLDGGFVLPTVCLIYTKRRAFFDFFAILKVLFFYDIILIVYFWKGT